MKCAHCQQPLTAKQQQRWRYKHGKKRFPPKPTCSRECTGNRRRAPPKAERPEEWARSETKHGAGSSWGSRGG